MQADPYIVSYNTFLLDAINTMVSRQIDTAVVQNAAGKVNGVFTSREGLQALSEFVATFS